MFKLAKDQQRGLMMFAALPWLALLLLLSLNWDYAKALWEIPEAFLMALEMLSWYFVALGFGFAGCLILNHVYPPENTVAPRLWKRRIINFLIFALTGLLVAYAAGMLWIIPAHVQLKKSSAFGQ